MGLCDAESAESVSDGTDPNDVPGGTAPDSPVQLPEFTAIDQSGSDFSLQQLQVCVSCAFPFLFNVPMHSPHIACISTDAPIPVCTVVWQLSEKALRPINYQMNSTIRLLTVRRINLMQGDFTLLVFGVTRDFEDAKSRLQNMSEIVRQTGRLYFLPDHFGTQSAQMPIKHPPLLHVLTYQLQQALILAFTKITNYCCWVQIGRATCSTCGRCL